MTDRTPRLALPLLAAGQAQKEIFHNEALVLLDALVQGAATGITNHPPAAPAEGACWIVGTAPDGEWAGQAGAIALRTAGGWRFVAPRPGTRLWLAGSDAYATFTGDGWEVGRLRGSELLIDGTKVVGEQMPAIADPSGGTTVDAPARAALAAVLAVLRGHGLIAT